MPIAVPEDATERRVVAEKMARRWFMAYRDQYTIRNGHPCFSWEELHSELRDDYIAVQLRILMEDAA